MGLHESHTATLPQPGSTALACRQDLLPRASNDIHPVASVRVKPSHGKKLGQAALVTPPCSTHSTRGLSFKPGPFALLQRYVYRKREENLSLFFSLYGN